MIKANELMIGDWVEPHQCRIPTLYCKVEGIYPDNTVHLDKAERLFSLDELHPIPLTAEILNKNFPDTRYNVFWFWDDIKEGNELWFEIRIEGEDMEFRMDMRYVHELQHALRLCRIDKEIKLED